MKSISQASLDKIAQKLGGEPIIFLTVNFGGGTNWFADKAYPGTPLEGRILELGNIDSVVKITFNASSSSVSVKLDDTDGYLKYVIDHVDIHKKTVYMWQWFSDIPFNDAFQIFEGEIASPIVWKEGDRTLSFDVIEKLTDNEIGFSLEEGQFAAVPQDIVGKAFPMGFGTNMKMKCLQITKPPAGIITDAIGIPDPSLKPAISKGTQAARELQFSAYLDLIWALQCAFSAFELETEMGAGVATGPSPTGVMTKNPALISSDSVGGFTPYAGPLGANVTLNTPPDSFNPTYVPPTK